MLEICVKYSMRDLILHQLLFVTIVAVIWVGIIAAFLQQFSWAGYEIHS